MSTTSTNSSEPPFKKCRLDIASDDTSSPSSSPIIQSQSHNKKRKIDVASSPIGNGFNCPLEASTLPSGNERKRRLEDLGNAAPQSPLPKKIRKEGGCDCVKQIKRRRDDENDSCSGATKRARLEVELPQLQGKLNSYNYKYINIESVCVCYCYCEVLFEIEWH